MSFTFKDLHEILDFVADANSFPEEFSLEIALEVLIVSYLSLQDAACSACDVDCIELGEHYMVTNEIWKRYGCNRGYLCLGCLEERMGRGLTAEDFINAPINAIDKPRMSDRMRDRLTT